jgi:hypothetical protein
MRLFHQSVQETLQGHGDFSLEFPATTVIDRFGNIANGIILARDSFFRNKSLGKYTLRGSELAGSFVLGDEAIAMGFTLEWRHLVPKDTLRGFNAYGFVYDVGDVGVDSFRLKALNVDDADFRPLQGVELPELTSEEKAQLFAPLMRNVLSVVSANASKLSGTIATNA